jgi:hypothetical protein
MDGKLRGHRRALRKTMNVGVDAASFDGARLHFYS